jgi:hypothetical protein
LYREFVERINVHLEDYLADVTADLNLHVTVDEGLHILVGEVADGLGRPVRESHSTVEQSYLFTRIALGRHLTNNRELGPLLLDDITSNADPDRVRRVLNLLRIIAQRRQVVVFSHDGATAQWFNETADADNPRLHMITLRRVRAAPERYALSHRGDGGVGGAAPGQSYFGEAGRS